MMDMDRQQLPGPTAEPELAAQNTEIRAPGRSGGYEARGEQEARP